MLANDIFNVMSTIFVIVQVAMYLIPFTFIVIIVIKAVKNAKNTNTMYGDSNDSLSSVFSNPLKKDCDNDCLDEGDDIFAQTRKENKIKEREIRKSKNNDSNKIYCKHCGAQLLDKNSSKCDWCGGDL